MTLKTLLKKLYPRMFTYLLSQNWLEKIHNITKDFPASITNAFGFESRLTDVLPKADFAFNIKRTQWKSIGNNTHNKEQPLSKCLFTNKYWIVIKNFFSQLTKDQTLNQFVNKIWFEYDIVDNVLDIVVPSIFINIENKMNDAIHISHLFQLLSGNSISGKVFQNLKKCIEQLPGGCKLNYLGFKINRNMNIIRISILNFTPKKLIKYLGCLKKVNHYSSIHDVVVHYYKFVDTLVLNLDIGEKVSSSFGIEYHLKKKEEDINNIRQWKPFLESLVKDHYCVQGKMENLLKWNKELKNTYKSQLFNVTTLRILIYFKSVYCPGSELLFKAYYGYKYI